MDLGLAGRVAIVAAASKGLGRAVAEELAREGANVAICSRTAADLERVATQIQKATGREVFWQAVDVGKQDSVTRFVASVEARFSCIDICVTNSGGPPSKLFADTKPDDWRAAFEQLLLGTVFFAMETLPRMKKKPVGAVHNHHLDGCQTTRGRIVAFQLAASRGDGTCAYFG